MTRDRRCGGNKVTATALTTAQKLTSWAEETEIQQLINIDKIIKIHRQSPNVPLM